MVTVVKTPQGHKLIDQAIEATVTDSGGDALVTLAYHGLGTGDHVYIDSDLDEYNGFWYVTAINADTFKLSEYDGADFVEYYQDADIDYYQTNDHVWNSIFLPIIYKISNDRWPTNTVDTARTISTTANDNGYLQVNASGTIKTGIQALEYVKISNSPDTDINGVWQIVEVISNSSVVIDAAYTATSLAGATIQYYYKNYQVKVKVYAGLPTDHPWESKKPYEEMAELSLTPDSNNLVMFSVADYIRGKVAIKNNPTLFSMPLNLDAFAAFYISVAEAFDNSDTYTVTTDESAYADDSFVGYAVAGKLPFKNIYSGDYADYIYTDGAPSNWLTNMDRLLAVEDKYFDISFIKNVPGNFILTIDKYIADYLTTTETVAYTDQGVGVYRIPITADATYDSFCVYIIPVPGPESVSLPALNTWVNSVGFGTDWTTGSNPIVNIVGAGFPGVDSEYLYADYSFIEGYTYAVTININKTYNSGSSNPRSITVMALDSSNNIIDSLSETTPSTDGADSITFTFIATEETTRIGVYVTDGSDVNIEIASHSATRTAPDAALTEEICIDMLESCEAVSGFTPTDIRLLEDGSYRILE